MLRSFCVILALLCAAPIGWAQQVARVGNETFVPAGTLLNCTLDEPNFSSQTAQIGDPVLCHLNSVAMFGRPVIPRGAYLSARLRDYRDPGHFFGKGWIQLEFTSLTLPGGSIPLNAKIISAGRYRVDGEGKVRGRGHPVRDAVEWTIPILWPVKLITLPARGPRPAFKGETRIGLRLMEDVYIPESVTATSSGLNSRSDDQGGDPSIPRLGNVRPANNPVTRPGNQKQPSAAQPPLTLLVLRGGRVYLVVDYWLDHGKLSYTTGVGAPQALSLDALDMPMTSRLNAERGVPFSLPTTTR
jgi:hypothetical protein